MNISKLNYYSIFLFLFRTLLIIEAIYFFIIGNFIPIFYCVLTFILTFLINLLDKVINLNRFNKFTLQLFIFLSLFVGNINNIYVLFPRWDDILHILSGFIIAFLALPILKSFNIKYSNRFLSFFIVLFGLSLAGAWEIYEYSVDYFFNLNTQGRSLDDTMMDIINGAIGPISIGVLNLLMPTPNKKPTN